MLPIPPLARPAQNLVKPPKHPNSPQPADSVLKINLETLSHFPLEIAILEIESNLRRGMIPRLLLLQNHSFIRNWAL